MADTTELSKQLQDLLPSLRGQYYRLLLIVGPVGSGKTALLKALCQEPAIPYVNVNLALSQRLLHLTNKERPLHVVRLLEDVISEQAGEIVALDNTELLFDRSLQVDPLACLQRLSRSRTLIVAWGGNVLGKALTYAEPGHPEYRRYDRPEANLFVLPGKGIDA